MDTMCHGLLLDLCTECEAASEGDRTREHPGGDQLQGHVY